MPNLNLGLALGTKDYALERLVAGVVEAADAAAFTVLDWEAPGGPSPVASTSVVLITLS